MAKYFGGYANIGDVFERDDDERRAEAAREKAMGRVKMYSTLWGLRVLSQTVAIKRPLDAKVMFGVCNSHHAIRHLLVCTSDSLELHDHRSVVRKLNCRCRMGSIEACCHLHFPTSSLLRNRSYVRRSRSSSLFVKGRIFDRRLDRGVGGRI